MKGGAVPTMRARVKRLLRTAVYKIRGVRLEAAGIKARGDSASDAYVFNEIFGSEDAYRRDVLVPLLRGGTVIEVGAHKGFFTVLAASVARRVLVFEPADKNHGFLLRNLRLNRVANTTVVKKAVSASEGTRQFTISDVTDARHTFFATPFSGNGNAVDVECTTLPAVLRDYDVDQVDVLKLDCEGSEYDVLLGCDRDTLLRVRNIALEIHEAPSIPHTRAELVSFLEWNGYSGEIYDEHDRDGLRTCMAIFQREAVSERR